MDIQKLQVSPMGHPGEVRKVSGGGRRHEDGARPAVCVNGPRGRYMVGQSGNEAAVAEFELLFPKVGKIASLLSVLTADSSSQHLE